MNQEIKKQDAPKIAAALFVLIALSGFGWAKMQGAAVQSEVERAALHMKRESGQKIQAGDEFLTPAQLDDAENKRQDADPNFRG